MPFINSTATGANDGSTEDDAYTSVVTAAAAHVPGDVFWMSHTSALTAANIVLAPTGTTRLQPFTIKTIDFATGLARAPANIQVDCSSGLFQINGECRFHGVNFKAAGGFNQKVTGTSGGCEQHFFDSILDNIGPWYSDTALGQLFKDCITTLTGSYFSRGYGRFCMTGGSISGSLNVNAGLEIIDDAGVRPEYRRVDMSGLTGGLLFRANRSTIHGAAKLIDCKMPVLAVASYWHSGVPAGGHGDCYIDVVNSANSGGKDTVKRIYSDGRLIETDTSVYLDTGFEQFGSGSRQSFKVTPASDTALGNPILCFPIEGFSETTGTKTLKLQIAHDFSTALKVGEFYVVVGAMEAVGSSFLGSISSANPVTGINHDRVTVGTALPTSVEAWAGADGLTTQEIQLTVTINETGRFTADVYMGRYEAGKTLRYNPEFLVT